MGLKENTTDTMPGAATRGYEVFSAADCAGFVTLQLLAGEAHTQGWPYTFVGGSLFIDETLANVQAACAA